MHAKLINRSDLSLIQKAGAARIEGPVRGPVIYFLLKGDSVMYVGQTTNVAGRLSAHRQKQPGFDEAWYIRCREQDLGILEFTWYSRLAPAWNQHTPPQNPVRNFMPSDMAFEGLHASHYPELVDVSQLAGITRVSVSTLRRWTRLNLLPIEKQAGGKSHYYRLSTIIRIVENRPVPADAPDAPESTG